MGWESAWISNNPTFGGEGPHMTLVNNSTADRPFIL